MQITTGAALVADDEIKSFRSEATNEGAGPGQIPVGERGLTHGGDRKSAAITVSGGRLVEVEVFAAGAPNGDKQAAAVVGLLQRVVDAG